MRGPWIAKQYYRTDEPGDRFSPDGWLRTGDVASISPLGYMRLVDRTKDLVKSGGEWISSVDLENQIMSHPKVAEAAVIAVPAPEVDGTAAGLRRRQIRRDAHPRRGSGVPRSEPRQWQLPDDVVFIDEIPKTSVGKFSKKTLRDKFADYELPTIDK